MSPRIPNDSYVLVDSFWTTMFLKPNQSVLFRHREFGLIVKTIAAIDHNGFIWSKGENDQSVSIEQIGPVSKNDIIGKVVYVFKNDAVNQH